MEIKTFLRVSAGAALLTSALIAVAQGSDDLAGDQDLVQIRGAQTLGGDVVGIPIDIDLRDIPAYPAWQPGDPIVEIPKRDDGTGNPQPEGPLTIDPLVERQRNYQGPSEPGFQLLLNFDADNSTANPNDPTGDIGKNYFIESYNGCGGSCIAIYDKVTGAQMGTTFALDSLSTGGVCANGLGDPIVLYDHLAERWLLTEFSSGGNGLCQYTSRTDDPVTGGWCAYSFQDTSFPDYPKYGVWPDQYVAGSNQGNVPPVYAFDRLNMLSPDGTSCPTARAPQKITGAPGLPGLGFELLVPADLDGPPPPAGEPAIFMRHRDEEMHGDPSNPATDPLEIWELDTDFDNSANTTFTQLPNVIISDYDSLLCPPVNVFSCIPQPSGPALDPLLEVIMNRLVYRNFGTHETLLGVLQTDIGDFEDHSGERWFELRRTPAPRGTGQWELFQEGTWSPDAEGRFMGMIAMDQAQNILLAYNVSSTSVFPSIRFTGRLATDPPGMMTLSEQELATGGGANSSIRYGDYNQMGIDPVDGCTFWMLGMYNPSGKAIRVGAVKFDLCDLPEDIFTDGFETPPPPAPNEAEGPK